MVSHLISSCKVDTNVDLHLGSQLFSSQKAGAIHNCLLDAWNTFLGVAPSPFALCTRNGPLAFLT